MDCEIGMAETGLEVPGQDMMSMDTEERTRTSAVEIGVEKMRISEEEGDTDKGEKSLLMKMKKLNLQRQQQQQQQQRQQPEEPELKSMSVPPYVSIYTCIPN